ncbi:ornithine cyclodeaminase family protein [Candidatus Poribacteria bacterium]|nr:ornithine cyclodeaminase family protein [Candidatus Poribacteria bacterium]MYH81485.1 ornithine cyclodeaminase family protein [Candidatus Poribacteria bacterium]MYK93707.1 ornithine cyclodeaminase family protein [Candidatus Poribacteria bacterium]
MSIRILSASDVRAALPMPKAIDAMRHAYSQLSAGKAIAPPRQHLSTDKGVTLIMPAYLPERSEFGIKVVSVYDDNPNLGLPRITATVLVLDPVTGAPKAFMDGASLTAIRTGAGGGVAADLLARQDAKTVAVFGAGVQARAQLQAVLAVRDVTRVNLISRTQASAAQLAAEISEWMVDAPEVNLVPTPEAVVQDADIVICATTSATPLFDGNVLQSGTHITAVGTFVPEKREVDTVTIRRAHRIVVDSREDCLAEAGDLIIPNAHIDAEIGEIINGDKLGRQSDDEITFFKSVGVAVQDAVAAAAVLAEAEAKGLGTECVFY